MKQKPTVGQKVFILNTGNSARHVPQSLKPGTVVKVGRKYFTVKRDDMSRWETEFHCDGWREKTQYSQNSALYSSEQEWMDGLEAKTLWKVIRDAFSPFNPTLPLESLRKINVIINESKSL